jgi:signal transduction histidine kinase
MTDLELPVPAPSAPTSRGSHDSILVVDDTIENLRLLSSMLDEQGYETRPVTNGKQALQAVEHDAPDLILLDINMPEMDGYEVCRRVKGQDQLRDIPVIFLTALTDTADKVRAFDVGGVDYITKPFQVEEVLARVRTHVELRRARLELLQSYEHLRELEELRDNLVHMIVHDMRTPLQILLASLETMKEDAAGELDPEIEENLRSAIGATQGLRRMANHVLDASRLEEGKMPLELELCDLTSMVREVAASFSTLERGRTITVEAADTVKIECDGAIVKRVLENLLSNGIKHTPSQGRLRIVLNGERVRVRVTVEDEGPGIPAEARARIFEKFGTLEARKSTTYHSAGLGLAFCKLAVEAHGGSIGVDTGAEGGSSFWFELPR